MGAFKCFRTAWSINNSTFALLILPQLRDLWVSKPPVTPRQESHKCSLVCSPYGLSWNLGAASPATEKAVVSAWSPEMGSGWVTSPYETWTRAQEKAVVYTQVNPQPQHLTSRQLSVASRRKPWKPMPSPTLISFSAMEMIVHVLQVAAPSALIKEWRWQKDTLQMQETHLLFYIIEHWEPFSMATWPSRYTVTWLKHQPFVGKILGHDAIWQM